MARRVDPRGDALRAIEEAQRKLLEIPSALTVGAVDATREALGAVIKSQREVVAWMDAELI